MTLELAFWIWLGGAATIVFLVGLYPVDDVYMKEELIVWGLLWPLIISMAIVVLPFYLLYKLGQLIRERWL